MRREAPAFRVRLGHNGVCRERAVVRQLIESVEVCIRLAFLVEVSKMLSIGLRYLNGAVGLLGIYTGLAVQDQMFYQLIAIC